MEKDSNRTDAGPAGNPEQVAKMVQDALDDAKAISIETIDVRGKTTITDFMVVASGNSTRHVKTLAESVVLNSKRAGVEVLGVEGESEAEWILVDLADVLVHLMLPRTRDFYSLESLWKIEDKRATG
ncbi:MAG: ribosome silencing factor [Xanthomonadales bacterium]|nr:ribosome silencing factor [Xanthomonadales bacterium]